MAKKKELSIADAAALGGKARAESLTKEQRSEAARKAVEARWSKDLPKATHEGVLHVGQTEIPCFVIEGGKRVLYQRAMVTALGMSRGSSSVSGGDRLAKFATGNAIKPYVGKALGAVTSPLKFRTTSGIMAYGYEATVLADLCDAVLEARKAGVLQKQQLHIADQCEVLMRGFARVGIIALVDEATGFQYDRPRRDLEEYLKKFLAESLVRWARTFPNDYFKHLCRLKDVELRPDMKLPQYFGHITNDLIYRRIAPGLLKALKERRQERGKQSDKLYWWTSEEKGHPELLLHLGTVVGLMKIHKDFDSFKRQLDEIAPAYPEVPGLFDDPQDWEQRQ